MSLPTRHETTDGATKQDLIRLHQVIFNAAAWNLYSFGVNKMAYPPAANEVSFCKSANVPKLDPLTGFFTTFIMADDLVSSLRSNPDGVESCSEGLVVGFGMTLQTKLQVVSDMS